MNNNESRIFNKITIQDLDEIEDHIPYDTITKIINKENQQKIKKIC